MADTDQDDDTVEQGASAAVENIAALDPRRSNGAEVHGLSHDGFNRQATESPAHLASETDPAVRKPPRFRIFIVDSGWNSAARKVLHDNFHLLRELQKENPIYFLGRDRSIDLMRRYPVLVGMDPIIRVHCEVKREHRKPGFHGFRLHMGLLRQPEKALQALQNFAKFVGLHGASADLEADMRKRLRQEGLMGAIEIVMRGEAHGVSI